jgi:N utilization substance protein B
VAARRKARKRALDVLFEADQRRLPLSEVLEARIAHSGSETPLPAYAIEIVEGVMGTLVELDAAISEAAEGWSLERMPAVDRAILRIAAWEILHNPEVETAVAISQAVDLAADLSTEASASFVNGVLGTIADAAPGGTPASTVNPVQ